MARLAGSIVTNHGDQMSNSAAPLSDNRRHDLDALRAFAMLLGIALHASLSFTGFPWIVQDSHSSFVFALAIAAVHGFRMQLFMLVSGFFTMMLYRKRGLRSLVHQRFRRVFVPCMLGLVTIVPALDFVSYKAMSKSPAAARIPLDGSRPAIFEALRRGDAETLKKELAAGADPNQLDNALGIPLLSWAALKGDVESVRILLDAGANVNVRSLNGSRPAHHAAFLGHAGILDLLATRGADLTARSDKGDSAADVARADNRTTVFYARALGVNPREQEAREKGRAECLSILEKHFDTNANPVPLEMPGILTQARITYSGWLGSDRFLTSWKRFGSPIHLFKTDIFHHLWFLWYLCWQVAAFALAAILFGRSSVTNQLWKVFDGRLGFAGLVALTTIPSLFMGVSAAGALGPDTSTGILPMPHLLVYYGLFFFYGAAIFDGGETALASRDKFMWLRVGLFLAMPASLATYGNPVTSAVAQSIYAWCMIFGLMSLFRRRLSAGNDTIRYLSDSSYWLYLAHLPLVVAGQSWISGWNLPSGIKFLGLTASCTALLLLSYQLFVRDFFIGRLLNGPKKAIVIPSENP